MEKSGVHLVLWNSGEYQQLIPTKELHDCQTISFVLFIQDCM